MLTGVVDEHGATGNAAAIPGYSVAGKTGTAQKPGPNGYIPGAYVASFVGMVPVKHPRLSSWSSSTSPTARSSAAPWPLRRSRRSPSSTSSTCLWLPTSRRTCSSLRPMNLERVSAALGPAEKDRQRRAGRDSRPRLRHARGRPGAPVLLRARVAATATTSRPAVAAGAVALVVERPLDPVPQLVVPSVRAGDAGGRGAVLRRPVGRADRRRGHRHERQDDLGVPAPLDPRGGGPAARRCSTNIERRVGGGVRPTGLNTPEAIDLQRLFREMLEAGDRSCVMEATSIAAAQGRLDGTRFAVLSLHEPDPGPPRLPRDDGGLFRREARPLRPGGARRRQRGGRVGETPCQELPGAEHSRRTTISARSTFTCAGASTGRTRSARSQRRASWDVPEAAIRTGIERVRGVPGPLRVGRRRPAVRRHRRLRPHARLARERAAHRARPSARAGSSSCSAQAATAIARSGR